MESDAKQLWRRQQRRSLWVTFWIVLIWVAGLAVVMFELSPAAWASTIFFALAVLTTIAVVVALFKNSRCPACTAYIRDHGPRLCPHCGVELR